MIVENCENCRFFSGVIEGDGAGRRLGDCRRRAPRPAHPLDRLLSCLSVTHDPGERLTVNNFFDASLGAGDTLHPAIFPSVDAEDWCGEFQENLRLSHPASPA